MKTLIVGGSVAGLRLAEAMSNGSGADDVEVVGAEPHMPYNRTLLTKGDGWSGAEAPRLPLAVRAAADVRWRLGTAVVHVDLAAREATLDDDSVVAFDRLAVATGVRARRLPFSGPTAAVRTVDDAHRLRLLRPGSGPVLVLGAGVLGCELAATLTARGHAVIVVGLEQKPMESLLGERIGALVRAHHERAGVRFRLGTTVVEVAQANDGVVAVLAEGEHLHCAAVIQAIGSDPNVEWLRGNGLDLSDGVLCDTRLAVENAEGVVAAGDVARFPLPGLSARPLRIEHWAMASVTARRAAATLLRPADPEPAPVLPSFWTDQGELRLRCSGLPRHGRDDVRTVAEEPSGTLFGHYVDGAVVGLTMIGFVRAMAACHRDLVDAVVGRASVERCGA